jgi:hypothetical protein
MGECVPYTNSSFPATISGFSCKPDSGGSLKHIHGLGTMAAIPQSISRAPNAAHPFGIPAQPAKLIQGYHRDPHPSTGAYYILTHPNTSPAIRSICARMYAPSLCPQAGMSSGNLHHSLAGHIHARPSQTMPTVASAGSISAATTG